MRSTFPNFRVVQCVLPSGGRCRVLANTRASSAGVRTVGGWPRYLACKPARRSVSNRSFHRADVRGIAANGRCNAGERVAIRQHQNDPRAAHVFRPTLSAARATSQFDAFINRQRERHMAPQYCTTDSVVTVH